jgi:N-acetylglucosamine-6-phosphate deacetylase
MAKHTAVPLHDIFRMATLTPAERTGIDAETGSLSVGKRADLLLLSKRLEVQSVVLGA